jgi:hypothetical protein
MTLLIEVGRHVRQSLELFRLWAFQEQLLTDRSEVAVIMFHSGDHR